MKKTILLRAVFLVRNNTLPNPSQMYSVLRKKTINIVELCV